MYEMLRRLRTDIGWILSNTIVVRQESVIQKYQKVPLVYVKVPVRLKYTINKGVKGIRNRKSYYESTSKIDQDEERSDESAQWWRDLNMDDK